LKKQLLSERKPLDDAERCPHKIIEAVFKILPETKKSLP
jgi:hypothetical protein